MLPYLAAAVRAKYNVAIQQYHQHIEEVQTQKSTSLEIVFVNSNVLYFDLYKKGSLSRGRKWNRTIVRLRANANIANVA